MARPLNHHLHIVFPCDLGQLAQCLQFAQLCLVIGVPHRAGAQAVAQRKRHVIGLHDFANFFKMRIEKTLAMVRQAPFRHDRPAARDNAGHAFRRQRHIAQQHAGMDGEIIHPLFGLLDERVAENIPGEFFGLAVDLFKRLINRHRAHRHRRVADNPLARFVNMLAGRQIHNRVGTPANAPSHFVNLFADRGRNRGIADIAVDFDQKIAADNHRFAFGMVDIGWNNGTPARDFIAHKFRCNFIRQRCPETLARMLARHHRCHARAAFASCREAFQIGGAVLVLANGDILHLRRDNALAGIMHLADILAGLGAARRALQVKAQRLQVFILQPRFAISAGRPV